VKRGKSEKRQNRKKEPPRKGQSISPFDIRNSVRTREIELRAKERRKGPDLAEKGEEKSYPILSRNVKSTGTAKSHEGQGKKKKNGETSFSDVSRRDRTPGNPDKKKRGVGNFHRAGR